MESYSQTIPNSSMGLFGWDVAHYKDWTYDTGSTEQHALIHAGYRQHRRTTLKGSRSDPKSSQSVSVSLYDSHHPAALADHRTDSPDVCLDCRQIDFSTDRSS